MGWWKEGYTGKTDLVSKRKKYFKVPRGNYSGPIISWKYDSQNNLIIVKKDDGLLYFPISFKKFSTLPKYDICQLAQIDMINPTKHGWGEHFQYVVRQEVKFGFKEMSVARPKRKIWGKNKIDPKTNKPWVRIVYPTIKSLRRIPLEVLPVDFLKNFKMWEYMGKTGEARIEWYVNATTKNSLWPKTEEIFVYDPLSLVNLSKDDLDVLNANLIKYNQEDEFNAYKFQKVVRICLEQGIYRGRNLPSQRISS